MTGLIRWVKARIKGVGVRSQKDDTIRELVERLVKKLGDKFVRRLREVAFLALQRKCERPLWQVLLKLARAHLDEQRQRMGWSPRPDPTQDEIGRALAGINQSTISHAQRGEDAPISLGTLLAALAQLEKHWEALGNLPAFSEIRDECFVHSIGFAQKCVNERFGLAPPCSERPTLDELAILKDGFPDGTAPGTCKVAWKNWGEGWLITKHKLGLTRGIQNATQESRDTFLPHGQSQPRGRAEVR